jgi:hypothetical protein
LFLCVATYEPRRKIRPPRTLRGPTFTYEDDRFDYSEQRFVTLGILAYESLSARCASKKRPQRLICKYPSTEEAIPEGFHGRSVMEQAHGLSQKPAKGRLRARHDALAASDARDGCREQQLNHSSV